MPCEKILLSLWSPPPFTFLSSPSSYLPSTNTIWCDVHSGIPRLPGHGCRLDHSAMPIPKPVIVLVAVPLRLEPPRCPRVWVHRMHPPVLLSDGVYWRRKRPPISNSKCTDHCSSSFRACLFGLLKSAWLRLEKLNNNGYLSIPFFIRQ